MIMIIIVVETDTEALFPELLFLRFCVNIVIWLCFLVVVMMVYPFFVWGKIRIQVRSIMLCACTLVFYVCYTLHVCSQGEGRDECGWWFNLLRSPLPRLSGHKSYCHQLTRRITLCKLVGSPRQPTTQSGNPPPHTQLCRQIEREKKNHTRFLNLPLHIKSCHVHFMVMLVGDGHVVRACISNKIVVSFREKSGFFREKKRRWNDHFIHLFIHLISWRTGQTL